jgi:hypothetical protein
MESRSYVLIMAKIADWADYYDGLTSRRTAAGRALYGMGRILNWGSSQPALHLRQPRAAMARVATPRLTGPDNIKMILRIKRSVRRQEQFGRSIGS